MEVILPVCTWGAASPRRALLVHGLGSSGATWWQIGSALADRGIQAIAPDLRGHGAAPSASCYRFADLAGDLAALGPRWDLVVGHSLGGPVVCELLARGVATDAVVLLDPVFDIGDADLPGVVADHVAEASDPPSAAQVAADNPAWHPVDAFLKSRAAQAVAPWTMERVIADNSPWHHERLAAELRGPTAVLGADPATAMCRPELGERLAGTMPSLLFQTVPGAGHSIHRDRPDVVLDACIRRVGR
ncbi:MAG: alpha/beta fold hydrolase [Phycicoccus sp.]